MKPNRITSDFLQAAGLLEADLIWSADFDAIRHDLATYLRSMSSLGPVNHPALVGLVQKLLADENDLTI